MTAIDLDSRRVGPGSLFCCLKGERTDGHDHAPEAIAGGAVALVVERPLDVRVPQLLVRDARVAMAEASVVFYGNPARSMTVIGVTGTNGKTTTTFLLREVFEEAGLPAEVLGTLSGARTTPESPELQARLAAMRDEGRARWRWRSRRTRSTLHRVDGTWFAVVVFTNLSRDHLDFHGTMEAYFEAKARLFAPAFTQRAVVERRQPPRSAAARRGQGARPPASPSTTLTDVDVDASGSRFTWRGRRVALSLAGRFNVSNALAAAESALAARPRSDRDRATG